MFLSLAPEQQFCNHNIITLLQTSCPAEVKEANKTEMPGGGCYDYFCCPRCWQNAARVMSEPDDGGDVSTQDQLAQLRLS